jgi:hypothetical protein
VRIEKERPRTKRAGSQE